jgi:two-component system cell cycle sensor histidine kinase/response regulator CckA
MDSHEHRTRESTETGNVPKWESARPGPSIIRDTRDREQVQEALHRSEVRYRRLFETAKDGILILDGNTGLITDVNPFLTNMLGYSHEEFLGKKLWEIGPFKDLEASRTAFEELQQREYIRYEDLPLQTKAGQLMQVEFVSNVYDVDGQRVIQCNIRDISDRKRADVAFRESEERYRVLFEQDTAGDYIADPDGRLLACNAAFARMFGFSTIWEAKQTGMASLYRNIEEYEAFLKRLKTHKRLNNDEVELLRKDGKRLQTVARVIGVFDPQGELSEIHGYLVDESERRRSEEQIRQAQKMHAMGRLAGGIAHDFNGLLQVIIGFTQLSLNEVKPETPIYNRLLEVEKAARSGAGLTHQLLAFTRQQVLQPTVLDLNAIIKDAGKMLGRLIGEDIAVVMNLGSDLGWVRADPTQLIQVILNLASNARDAMPLGGKLTIETANVNIDDDRPEGEQTRKPGRYVALRVTDTGTGMDQETQSHIFEPFFTTKGVGRGTGLGLAMVYGITSQSNGYISVHSELGRGASFEILLPSMGKAGDGQALEVQPGRIPRGSETILLVEDATKIRELVCEFLQISGYKVLIAGSSAEAIQVAGEYEGAIHLVLSDVVMPGVRGPVIVEHLLTKRPGMQVLFMSGYTDDRVTQDKVNEEGFNFIHKPFTQEALAGKVREILDAAGVASQDSIAD